MTHAQQRSRRFGEHGLLSPAAWLARRAGRPAGRGGDGRAFEPFETLENRILLADDHANFDQVFNTNDPVLPAEIVIDGTTGIGSRSGIIDPALDDDMFRFTAPQATFVTVWADTINNLSQLDSRVEVYTGTLGGQATLVASGSNNGTLTGGSNNNGWAGFIAQAGVQYFIRVLSDRISGLGSTGQYVVRVDAITSDPDNPGFDVDTGEATLTGSIAANRIGGDIVYRVVLPNNPGEANFNGLMTINATANPNNFDSRLDIYDANGVRIAFDSDTGRLSNAFTVAPTRAGGVVYVRVRSDRFAVGDGTASGAFVVTLDAGPETVPIDPVIRRGQPEGLAFAGAQRTYMYDFSSQGSGLHFINARPAGLVRLEDPSIRLYNAAGQLIGFNDDFSGTVAQLEIQLVGGTRYFVVVEGFDYFQPGTFALTIEAHHTWANNSNLVIDDHRNTVTAGAGTPLDQTRRQLELATPIVWGEPYFYRDAAGNVIRDRSGVVDGFITGRIHGTGDTDLFSFVPPIDMLGQYEGTNDGNGWAVYAGGEFDEAGRVTDALPDTANHVAAWDAGNWWPALRGLNGPVYSMAVYQPVGAARPQLFVGGDFTLAGNTANPDDDIDTPYIARWSFSPIRGRYEWSAVGAGFDAPVRAMTVYDPPDPDGGQPTPPILVIGGEFTGGLASWNGTALAPYAGGVTGTVLALHAWDPVDPEETEEIPNLLAIGGTFTSAGGNNFALYDGGAFITLTLPNPNDAVRAFTVWDLPEGDLGDPPPTLIVGGSFTQAGGAARSRIARFDFNAVNGAQSWGNLGAGANNTVHALAAYDPDGEGEDFLPVVVAGGEFTNIGSRIAQYDGGWSALGDGTNGPVYTITTTGREFDYLDPDIDEDPGRVVGVGTALFIGGAFTQVDGFDANNAAKWELDPFGMFFWDAMSLGANGTNGPIRAMVEFDDKFAADSGSWDRNDRAASRLRMTISPDGGSFANMFVRVYRLNADGELEMFYQNDTIAPPFPDPAGSRDPSLAPNQPDSMIVDGIWGGETYYVEISSVGFTGRYSGVLTVDAGLEDDTNNTHFDVTDAGDWANAPELIVATATGDTRNYIASPLGAYEGRGFVMSGSGVANTQLFEFGMIHAYDDTDLFYFTALETGTTEIRLNTTNLAREHFESFNFVNQLRTLQSNLDGVVRVFDNDFQQIAYSDDAGEAVTGRQSTTYVGSFANRTFYRRDPRVVFNVERGKRYFVQVESGQLANIISGNLSEVAWGQAIGAYELLVNTMPNLSFEDDHANTDGAQATPIPIIIDPGSPNNGKGSITGVIRNTFANPNDQDIFTFFQPASGLLNVQVVPDQTDFAMVAGLFDSNFNLIALRNGTPGETLNFDLSAVQGDRFIVAVLGLDGDEGSYTVNINAPPVLDDHSSLSKRFNATQIPTNSYDYDGVGEATGRIEETGDVDVFKFETTGFDIMTVTVQGTGGFRPYFDVYEVSEDLVGHAIPLRIAFADSDSGANATIRFPITAPDRTSFLTGNTYNFYYIVVRGSDPTLHTGNYTLTFNIIRSDDHPDAGQFEVATVIPIDPGTGEGSESGEIEKPGGILFGGDTDLFTFDAIASGQTTIVINSPPESLLRAGVRVFNADFEPINDETTGDVLVIGPDEVDSNAIFTFRVFRGSRYYILVEGLTGGSVKTADTGTYGVAVTTPKLDDHANEGEFPFATVVSLSRFTGDGLATGELEIPTDTDLFRFTTIVSGDMVISISTPSSDFTPVVRFFDTFETELGTAVVDGGAGDEDGVRNGTVVRRLGGALANERYYVLVSSDAGGVSRTGAYTAFFDGPKPPPGVDDHANAGEFDDATVIPLSRFNADGREDGTLELGDDTDLFTFATLNAGTTYLSVTRVGQTGPNYYIRLFGPDRNEIAYDSAGIPGADAYLVFEATGANQRYWIEVGAEGGGTGNYTVRVDSTPEIHTLYFPEGFASSAIREYVSVANPNPFDVAYTIRLRYSDGQPETIIWQDATIFANSRAGVAISDGANGVWPGVLPNTPYSIIIESTAPLGATLSHYDGTFSGAVGEAFTSETSRTWSFARGERRNSAGLVNDYVTIYNPNDSAAIVTLTAYSNSGGAPVILEQTIQGGRRGGWSFHDETTLPSGVFTFVVTSRPANANDAHMGIVASLTHYDQIDRSSWAVLGNSGGGSTHGAVPGIVQSDTAAALLSFANHGSSAVTININGTYIDAGLPGFQRQVQVAPFSVVELTGSQLGLGSGLTAGLRFSATAPVTVQVAERQLSDADSSLVNTRAGLTWFFGDGFMNRRVAGQLYFEQLFFFNPNSTRADIRLTFFFNDATSATFDVSVNARDFSLLRLHELPTILNRGGLQFYSIQANSLNRTPFVMSMTHYDQFLGGGWTNIGAPLGLTMGLDQFA